MFCHNKMDLSPTHYETCVSNSSQFPLTISWDEHESGRIDQDVAQFGLIVQEERLGPASVEDRSNIAADFPVRSGSAERVADIARFEKPRIRGLARNDLD